MRSKSRSVPVMHVRAVHPIFGADLAAFVHLVPTDSTRWFLGQHGLYFSSDGACVTIHQYLEDNGKRLVPVCDLPDKFNLIFKLRVIDTGFVKFTKLPKRERGNDILFYHTDAGLRDKKHGFLTFPSDVQPEVIGLRPAVFRAKIRKEDIQSKLIVKDASGKIASTVITISESYIYLNTIDLPDGRYDTFDGERKVMSFYKSSENLREESPLGLIEISLEKDEFRTEYKKKKVRKEKYEVLECRLEFIAEVASAREVAERNLAGNS